jgi:hypothetical protein
MVLNGLFVPCEIFYSLQSKHLSGYVLTTEHQQTLGKPTEAVAE